MKLNMKNQVPLCDMEEKQSGNLGGSSVDVAICSPHLLSRKILPDVTGFGISTSSVSLANIISPSVTSSYLSLNSLAPKTSNVDGKKLSLSVNMGFESANPQGKMSATGISPSNLNNTQMRRKESLKQVWEENYAQKTEELREEERRQSGSQTHSGSVIFEPVPVMQRPTPFSLRRLVNIFRSKRFPDKNLENLYRRYFFKVDQSSMSVMNIISIVLCVILIAFAYGSGHRGPLRGIMLSIIILLYGVLEVLLHRIHMEFAAQRCVCYASLLLMLGVVCTISLDIHPAAIDDGLWVTVFFVYMIYTGIPLSFFVALIMGVLLPLVQMGLAFRFVFKTEVDKPEFLSNIMIYVATNIIGIFFHYPMEAQQREAFLETRNCISVRLNTSKENEKQERLLLSVLPRHVAMEMKSDIAGNKKEAMFHKIYIQRHDNVRHVHISEATKDYLEGDYDIEPGHGAQRDAFLASSKINTYLIKVNTRRYKAFEHNPREHVTSGAMKLMGIEEKGHFSMKHDRMFSDHMLCQAIIVGAIAVSHFVLIGNDPALNSAMAVLITFNALLFIICCLESITCVPTVVRKKGRQCFRRKIIAQTFATLSIATTFVASIYPMLPLAAPDLRECLTKIYGNFTLEIVRRANITRNSKRTVCNHDRDTQFFPEHIVYAALVTLLSTSVFLEASSLLKLLITIILSIIFLLLIEIPYVNLFVNKEYIWLTDHGYEPDTAIEWMRLQWEAIAIVVIIVFILFLHGQQVESTARLDFIWKVQAQEEKEQMENLRAYNLKLLSNILPLHVAKHFLNMKDDTNLYYEDINNVGVMFASITNFSEFYMELEANNEGVECLRLLNEIIADFDTLLTHRRFYCVEKIKTVGQTYMCASGLTSRTNFTDMTHILALADYTFALQNQLQYINDNSFNNFVIRIGLNIGPVVAGVIGVKKPHYDIWGNSVNVASRMDSTGVPGKIQVTSEMYRILATNRYSLTERGFVRVKGKGDMRTFFLESMPPGASLEDMQTFD
ncbi:hypothetical protein EGW08_011335 [Elysia chlorotica]|uniref:adenylate cyclase n=1 Tax=Elysia chlorotica TaxID=188477 RepID=A0A3S1B6D8_ELYCH|nr:hypothetical protein EGW08_011335 [Elysia chlorotica]